MTAILHKNMSNGWPLKDTPPPEIEPGPLGWKVDVRAIRPSGLSEIEF
jgi:hypothetical protein